LRIRHFNGSAALLASTRCRLLGEFNEAKGLRIFITSEMTTDIETQIS